MIPQYILADATPGVVYNKQPYSKNSYAHTALWVSFDYGKNWTFREESIGSIGYLTGLNDSVIFKGQNRSWLESRNYGETFYYLFTVPIPYSTREFAYHECEFIGLGVYPNRLQYTNDCANSFLTFLIDSEYIFGQIEGVFPDVYRGGLPGEVYVSSWFPGWSYKVSFSDDYGETFRHVYIYEDYDPYNTKEGRSFFMSDREPGVFYIFRGYEIATTNPWGWHSMLYIEYYRDYGETLEATFCHNLDKNYEYKEIICDNTTYLNSDIINTNYVQLQWVNSSDNIRGYHVYRNNVRITDELLNDATFLDENLPDGNYKYYVRTYYNEGCVSDSSNHVTVSIKDVRINNVGIIEEIKIYPNPIEEKLQITSYKLQVERIEIFDVYGSNVYLSTRPPVNSFIIDISYFTTGIYFVRIITESGIITKRIVKL